MLALKLISRVGKDIIALTPHKPSPDNVSRMLDPD